MKMKEKDKDKIVRKAIEDLFTRDMLDLVTKDKFDEARIMAKMFLSDEEADKLIVDLKQIIAES